MKQLYKNCPAQIIIFSAFFLLIFGCSKTVYEKIKSNPPQADIYWGKSSTNLIKSKYKTPFSNSVPESKLEPRCFQVKKDGYRKSKIYCRKKNVISFIRNFELIPLKTTITSKPPGASIYWGSAKEKTYKTEHMTPHIESDVKIGASWKDWYFQVKKNGYNDSAIIIKAKEGSDRHVHFDLMPTKQDVGEVKPIQMGSKKIQVTFGWEYAVPTEILGFEIERRKELDEHFIKIDTIGPNETRYTDTGLMSGTTYYYRMRAYDANSKSDFTNVIQVKILDDGTVSQK